MNKILSFFKNHRKAAIIILVLVIAIGGIAGALAATGAKNKAASQVETNVTVLSQKDLDQIITTKGVLQSTNKLTVSTQLTAKVTQIVAEVGDVVAAGDVLAQLETDDYDKTISELKENIATASSQQKTLINQAAKRVTDASDQKTIDLQQKQKAIDDASINLEDAKNDLNENAKDQADAAVKARVLGDEDVILAQTKLSAARSALLSSPGDAAQAAYDAAYDEYKDEYDTAEDAIWDDEWEDAYNSAYSSGFEAVDAAQSAYDAAVTNYNNFARSNDLTIQEKSYALSNQKLQDPTATLESQLQSAQINLEDTIITAPVSGTITEVIASLGSRPNGALFVIQSTDSLEISTTVAEYDVPLIHEGQSVRFTTEATGGDELSGTVELISPTAVNSDGDFEVIVRIDTPDQRLRIGMNAKLTVVLESRAKVFSVPYDAVTKDEAGQSVIVALEADGITRRNLPVTVGMETDYFVEINGADLKDGLTILNDPEGKNVVTTQGPTGPFAG